MSLENHPNFHAVKFATDTTVSYYESLRGAFQSVGDVPPSISIEIQNIIVDTARKIEDLLDEFANNSPD